MSGADGDHAAVFWGRLEAALAEVEPSRRIPPPGARAGAVLVLIEEAEDGLRVVLTRRRRDLRSHPGQLSFPGGRLDPGESVEEAALREAAEEVGLRADSVEVVGTGPVFYIPPSRFWVAPVLARWARPHALDENPWEVDAILRVPLARLIAPESWRHAPLSVQGSTWAWQLDEDLLWGATAVVLGVLLDTALPGWHGGLDPHELGPEREVRPWEQVPSLARRARLAGELPSVPQEGFPHVTADQLRAVRAWLERHGVGELARAEQVGRALAHAARRLRGRDLDGATVTVLAGPSSNGAGGLAAARLLLSAGARVQVLLAGPARHRGQLELLAACGVPIIELSQRGDLAGRGDHGAHGPDGAGGGPPHDAGGDPSHDAGGGPSHDAGAGPPHGAGDLLVDALLGIGSEPPLTDLPREAVRWLRRHDVPVVSAELPSGLHPETGLRGPCVTADVTVALGLPLVGLQETITHAFVGDLYLADIGVPRAAWESVGVELAPHEPFAEGPLVRLCAGQRASDAGTPDQAVPGG